MSEHPQRIYLYAIIDGDAPLVAPVTGFAAACVALLPVQTLAAVIGPITIDQIKDTAAAALVHEHVVETLMATRRVLPVRFGTVFSSEAALAAALNARHAILCADLERLDGRVEIGVRVLWDGAARRAQAIAAQRARRTESIAETGPGLQYMQARMDELAVERDLRRAAEGIAHAWAQRLAPLVMALTTKALATEEIPVSLACLVAHTEVTALVAAIATFPPHESDIRAVCTGPWPPYHFVTDAQGE
jgi:hypothetical protein